KVMESLGYARRVGTHGRSESQMGRTLRDLPEAAGRLRAGKKGPGALNLMGELSPQYLRHFLAHLDTLAWIAQVEPPAAKPAEKAATPARRRSRKRAATAE